MNQTKNEEMKASEYTEAWNYHIDDFNRLFWHTDDMQKRAVKSAQDILRKVVSDIAERDFKED